ncbi:MAG TPA: glycosyltransferase family 9 protein [Gemmatimonadales bacterium]|nr:glycosyltransferase family 9 protein [Gemmatimonadales bacterium]
MIQTAFLGDVVLTTGLLTHLAERFGPVDVVTTRAAAALLETHPAVQRVLVYDKRGADRGIGGLIRAARELRRAGYARAYLPHRSIRTAALALLARIPERIGFAGSAGGLGYTRLVPRPVRGHEAERILALAQPDAGAQARVALGLTAQDRQEAAAWLEDHGVAEPFVAIAPGSIWGTKRWPGYSELAARIPEPVVIIGGPEDRALGDAIAAAARGRVHVGAGALSLRGSAALVERALVLVTNDSAPLHLGSAVGTRTVAIFGPTIPGFGFGPRGPADRIVELNGLPCRPCSTHGPEVCPLGHHRCMRDLGVDAVLEAVSGER